MIRRLFYKSFIYVFLSAFFVFSVNSAALAQHEEATPHAEKEEGFNIGEMIMHHIADAHEWHFATLGHTHVTLPLPVIIYSADKGLEVFSSSHLYHSADRTYGDYQMDEHDHIHSVSGRKIYDFSITKNVASLLLSAVILLGVFFSVSSGYNRNKGKAPSGIQSFFEPIIVYIRDDVAKTNIGPRYERYLPFLLTIFFFIWFNNLLGLLPGSANLTGNIAVTMTLALITFFVTMFSTKKYYWQHIFATPGVPKPLLLIMIPVEIIGIFTKPFSLMVRLFANITAGHIIMLSFIGLIFIAKSTIVSPVVVAFSVFMNFIELFVALMQAYIFTLLASTYIGSAVEEHHHDDHEHEHEHGHVSKI